MIMAIESFKETFRLLARMPLLWVPGLVGGILMAGLWLLMNFTGVFFTSKLFVIASLLLFLFIVGMIVVIKEDSGDIRAMVQGGITYYFRVLLPELVILFMLMLLFMLLIVTFGFTGTAPDPSFVATLTICIMIPTLMLTFFFDMAAVFEDRKVFESIQRSTALVSANLVDVIAFYFICALSCLTLLFSLMIVWELALFSKLEPVYTIYQQNQSQVESMTYNDWMGVIGTDGIWITALVIFIGVFILIPFLYSYKACFFKKLTSGAPATITQMSGEYDSKGRWYKY
jgi:hypothetical protein